MTRAGETSCGSPAAAEFHVDSDRGSLYCSARFEHTGEAVAAISPPAGRMGPVETDFDRSRFSRQSPPEVAGVLCPPGTRCFRAFLRAVEELYLGVLARTPTDAEQQRAERYLKSVGNRQEAVEDLVWVLVNSTEFITKR